MFSIRLFFQNPLEKAQAAKNKGNKYFKAAKYDQAIKCYTEAIRICPPENKQEIATFYQNRAAAYEQLVSIVLPLGVWTWVAYCRAVIAQLVRA